MAQGAWRLRVRKTKSAAADAGMAQTRRGPGVRVRQTKSDATDAGKVYRGRNLEDVGAIFP